MLVFIHRTCGGDVSLRTRTCAKCKKSWKGFSGVLLFWISFWEFKVIRYKIPKKTYSQRLEDLYRKRRMEKGKSFTQQLEELKNKSKKEAK